MGKIKGAPKLTDSTQALIKPTKYAKSNNTTVHDELANLRTASTLKACTSIFNKISLSPEKTEIPPLEISHLYLHKLVDLMSKGDKNTVQAADDYFSQLMRGAKNLADCQQAWNEAGAFFPESRCELTNTEKLFLERQYELLRNLGTERDEAIEILLQSETLEELNARLGTHFYKATFQVKDAKDSKNNTKTHYINVNKLRYEGSRLYAIFQSAEKGEPYTMPTKGFEAVQLIDRGIWKARDYNTPDELFHNLEAYKFAGFDKGIQSCLDQLQSMLFDCSDEETHEWNQSVKQDDINKTLEEFSTKTAQNDHEFSKLSEEACQSLTKFYKQFAWVKREHLGVLDKCQLSIREDRLTSLFQDQETLPGLEEACFNSTLIAQEPILAPLAFLLKLWNPKTLNLEIFPKERRGYFPLLVANAQNLENVDIACAYEYFDNQESCVGAVKDLNLVLKALKNTKANVALELITSSTADPSVQGILEKLHSNAIIPSISVKIPFQEPKTSWKSLEWK